MDSNKIFNQNNINNNNKTHVDENNLCIVCWSENGIVILCINCKFRYCNDCVKKVNGKCCICYRNDKKKYIYFNDDDFEINYSPHFYTTCMGIIFSIIIFISSCFCFSFLFIIIIKIFVDFFNFVSIKYLF